jgi:hypothetical protein
MKQLEPNELDTILKNQRIRPRILKNLRYNPDPLLDWSTIEIYAIPTRSNAEGILLIDIEGLYIVPYELNTKTQDRVTGRAMPITCDLCLTWQSGSNSGRITFTRLSDGHTLTYLCCADLKCSLHVRNLTPEGILSRTQLQEDMTVEQRIDRLKLKTQKILQHINALPAER